MGLFDWLLSGDASPETGSPDVVQRIADLLDGFEPAQAQYLGAFAYLLGRVANIDDALPQTEVGAMRALVAREGGVDASAAQAVVASAQALSRAERGTEDFRVAQEFNRMATEEQKLGLVRCLFAVAAADASVSLSEDNEIRRITQELGISHEGFIKARLDVRQHLAVTRPPARAGKGGDA